MIGTVPLFLDIRTDGKGTAHGKRPEGGTGTCSCNFRHPLFYHMCMYITCVRALIGVSR